MEMGIVLTGNILAHASAVAIDNATNMGANKQTNELNENFMQKTDIVNHSLNEAERSADHVKFKFSF